MKTLFVCPNIDQSLGLFNDLIGNERACVKYVQLKKGLYKWIAKVIYTFQNFTRTVFALPSFVYDYELSEYLKQGVDKIVIRSNVLEYVPVSFFQSLRKQGYKCEILLLDSLDADNNTIKATRKYLVKELWDKIITFDMLDAKHYGFEFCGFHYYSKHKLESKDQNVSQGLYFIGCSKGGRFDMIHEISQLMECHGIQSDLNVVIANKQERELLNKSILHIRKKSIPYGEVLESIHKSNCILEILREKQSGPSLRYFEAVVYNKKLLTNNPYIVQFPYYNPQYMKIFSSPEEIDIDWLKKEEEVDYHYAGEFSPLKLIDVI